MEYKIITASSIPNLEKTVNDFINDGWTPLSCPIFSGMYYQAMTKVKKSK